MQWEPPLPILGFSQEEIVRVDTTSKDHYLATSKKIWWFLEPRNGIQWTLANPNSLGPEPIQISEIFGLVKATAAMCVIVTAPYLHSVLGSLGSLSLLHIHRTQNTAPELSFSTLLIHLTRKT